MGIGELRIWPFDVAAACGLTCGRPMQIIGFMIGAIALTMGNCTVVSSDSDLKAIPGLTLENWR